MKRWIHAAEDTVDKLVRDYITRRIENEDEETSFLDGDDFAWAQDEVVYSGSISKCIEDAKKILKEEPERIDDIGDVIYDSYDMLYDMGDIVRLFREHGKELPDWYFE